jgi:hypothetical protein
MRSNAFEVIRKTTSSVAIILVMAMMTTALGRSEIGTGMELPRGSLRSSEQARSWPVMDMFWTVAAAP